MLAIVCTASIFFFPAICGPYSAVHGPVTTLRSIKRKLQMWLVLALAAFHVLAPRLPGWDSVLRLLRWEVAPPRLSFPDNDSPLRC